MPTVAQMPPKHSPIQSYIRAEPEAIARTDGVIARVRRRYHELALTQTEVARLLSIDPRTLKDIVEKRRPRVVRITQKQVSRIVNGELNVSGSSGGRGLLVGPGVEMLFAMEQALDVAPGDFTRDIYWASEGGSLEDRIKSEVLDDGARDGMLILLQAAQSMGKVRGPKKA